MIITEGQGPTVCVSIPLGGPAEEIHALLRECFPKNRIVLSARRQINAAIGDVGGPTSRKAVADVLRAVGYANVEGESIATLVPPELAPLREDDRCTPEVAHAFRRLIGRECYAGETAPVDDLTVEECLHVLEDAPTDIIRAALVLAVVWGRVA